MRSRWRSRGTPPSAVRVAMGPPRASLQMSSAAEATEVLSTDPATGAVVRVRHPSLCSVAFQEDTALEEEGRMGMTHLFQMIRAAMADSGVEAAAHSLFPGLVAPTPDRED